MERSESPAALPARQGTKVFLASSIVAQVCALVRYVLLARLLGPEQLGWAATLILTAQFFDSITNTGGDRFVIQHEAGDRPEVLRLVHLSAILRGCLTAVALVAFAIPIAQFLGQPRLAVPLMTLALAPFLLGFMHLDLRRQQRHNDFRAEGWATLSAELVALVVTGLAAWYFRDFTAALYGLITRALVLVLVSHFCAERSFSVGWTPEFVRPLTRFAMPLMASGLLMFIGSQSDRVLVGHSLGPAALGQYSAVLLLILYPSAMMQRYIMGTYMPLIVAARRTSGGGSKGSPSDSLAVETVLLSLAMVVGFALVAPIATVILYGQAFRQDTLLIALIGLLQVYRFLRLWPTTEGLAIGRSSVPMIGNLLRIIGLPAALLAINLQYGLNVVISCFIGGEIIALLVAGVLANRARGLPWNHDTGRAGLFMTTSTLTVVAAGLASQHDWFVFAVVAMSIVTITAWFVMREADALAKAVTTLMRFIRPRGLRAGLG